jgi:hypothetical protein
MYFMIKMIEYCVSVHIPFQLRISEIITHFAEVRLP